MKETEKKTAAQLRSLIEEASALLKRMENVPEEPEQDLVLLGVQFGGFGRVYNYAALKVEQGWYITGVPGLSKIEWHEIFDFFEGRNAKVIEIEPCVRISDVPDFI